MDNNTLIAGVSPDGIKNKTDVKILICFMLNLADDPLTQADLSGLIFGSSMANFLEVCDAIEHLLKSGNVEIDKTTDILSLTQGGKAIAEELKGRLPNTVKEKAKIVVKGFISRRRNERHNRVEITPCDGGYKVICTISSSLMEGGMMSVSVFVPGMEQAKNIRERFYDDPETLYRLTLAQLTGDKTLIEDK